MRRHKGAKGPAERSKVLVGASKVITSDGAGAITRIRQSRRKVLPQHLRNVISRSKREGRV